MTLKTSILIDCFVAGLCLVIMALAGASSEILWMCLIIAFVGVRSGITKYKEYDLKE